MIDTYDGPAGLVQFPTVRALYADVYAEPPYCEGPADVADFAAGWQRRCEQPGFRLVIARDDTGPVGFTFGHQLPNRTTWWDRLLEEVSASVTTEWPGRTFVVIELAVRADHRKRGVAASLHRALLADTETERVALLCRPDADAAQAVYAAWGYRRVGPLQPYAAAPVYDAMLRDLPAGDGPRVS